MAELHAKPALDHAPVETAMARIARSHPGPIHSVAPFRGKEGAVDAALRKLPGVGLPKPGRVLSKGDARVIWSGLGQFMLVGASPPARGLLPHAAVTDQTDAWAGIEVTGAGAEAVLARVCPLDLRAAKFGRGATARSEVGHVMAIVSRIAGGIEVMVMRSFAETAWQEIATAARSLAAQAALDD